MSWIAKFLKYQLNGEEIQRFYSFPGIILWSRGRGWTWIETTIISLSSKGSFPVNLRRKLTNKCCFLWPIPLELVVILHGKLFHHWTIPMLFQHTLFLCFLLILAGKLEKKNLCHKISQNCIAEGFWILNLFACLIMYVEIGFYWSVWYRVLYYSFYFWFPLWEQSWISQSTGCTYMNWNITFLAFNTVVYWRSLKNWFLGKNKCVCMHVHLFIINFLTERTCGTQFTNSDKIFFVNCI